MNDLQRNLLRKPNVMGSLILGKLQRETSLDILVNSLPEQERETILYEIEVWLQKEYGRVSVDFFNAGYRAGLAERGQK